MSGQRVADTNVSAAQLAEVPPSRSCALQNPRTKTTSCLENSDRLRYTQGMTTTQATGHRVGYARVSTHSQREDSQVDELQAAGCEKVFVDKASGKLAKRPQLDACLEYLRDGDVLVITRLSRAMRSLKHMIELAHRLQERGIGLVVLKQQIDTTTPTGRLMFHLLAAIDEFQRELIVEGTNEGLAAARARGRTGGRKAKLSPAQVALARQLYDQVGEDGKRTHTVEEIGQMFGVTRATVYRSLERQANCQPAAAHSA